MLSNCSYHDLIDDNPIFCKAPSELKNGLCNIHQHHINNIEDILDYEKRYTVTTVKAFLKDSEKAVGKVNKAIICEKIYSTLALHKNFLIMHEKFRQTVLEKLFEFDEEADENIMNILQTDKFKRELFPEIFNNSENPKIILNEKEVREIKKEKREEIINIVL